MSCFRLFTHDIITQNTNHRNTMYLYRGHSAITSLRKGERVDKRATKMTQEGGRAVKNVMSLTKFFYVLFFVTQSFLLSFSWSPDNITASNKKSISKKEPTSVSEITISYLNSTIIISLLCQCGLFVQTFMSKNSIFVCL